MRRSTSPRRSKEPDSISVEEPPNHLVSSEEDNRKTGAPVLYIAPPATPTLARFHGVDVPQALKPAVDESATAHRIFDDSDFWTRIPAWRDVGRSGFLDWHFQYQASVTKFDQLERAIGPLVAREFLADVHAGMHAAPMNLRITPYLLSLIDWSDPYHDPIRRQFIPVASGLAPDHPMLLFDSLDERKHSPTPGLVHRYYDKALFLPIDVCPVYCRFCTRSYAVGGDTETVTKTGYKPVPDRWKKAFAYLASRPEIEDVVVSGGDAFNLHADRIREIGEALLSIDHIRRIRIATKGPAVMPMKILTDTNWTDALCGVVDAGRALGKEVCLHTHFNSVREITSITREAMDVLFRRGVKVRNQSVLIRGVNDNAPAMISLVRKLSYMNVQPYYVYQHDMVKGVEDLRTSIAETQEIEKQVRGSTAGFNTPTFVTDAPGGGGKRGVHAYDHYDRNTGISVYRSPAVDAGKVYLYFDPISTLPEEGRRRWADAKEHETMLREAVKKAGLGHLQIAR